MLFASEWQNDTAHLEAGEPLPGNALFARRVADLLERGECHAALKGARLGTSEFPDYATGWYMRARAECTHQDYEAALASIERCLALEPFFYSAWSMLEKIHVQLGRLAAARSARRRWEEIQCGASWQPEKPAQGSPSQPEKSTWGSPSQREKSPWDSPSSPAKFTPGSASQQEKSSQDSPSQPEKPDLPEFKVGALREMKPRAPESHRNALILVKPGTTGSFETPTLAEVYRRQGLFDRALGVYRRILERHPDDAGARAMVQKLEDELATRRRATERA